MGKKNIDEITVPELLAVLRQIEHRGKLVIAHRALEIMDKFFVMVLQQAD